MPAAPALLAQCDQPIGFDGRRVGKQCEISRSQLLDDPDATQKSDPAALFVSSPSGPISK